VDLDLQKGNAADLLDAEPRLDLSDISADPSRLDESMLEVFTSKTEHGVDVIASRKHSVDLLSLDPTGIFAILNAVGRKYDIVVLDLPSVFLPWAEEVVRNSDRVFVTASYSVPSALRVTALLHRFDHAHIPRSDVTVVVNKRPSSFFGGGLRRREFEKAIAPVQPLYLTSDEKFAVECSNLGRPMMAVNKRRRICKEIRGLTQSLRPARETKAAGGAKSADRSL
jgi:pilus assembly protein CpaE